MASCDSKPSFLSRAETCRPRHSSLLTRAEQFASERRRQTRSLLWRAEAFVSPALRSLLQKAEALRLQPQPAYLRPGHVPFQSTGRLPRNVLVWYLVRELLLYFIVAFLFFFLIFFVNQILLMAERVLQKKVPVLDVAQLMLYSLPFSVAQSAPFATIVGFLMCLGRLMTDNEILIFRASGKSYAMLLGIVIVLGVGISTVSFGVNDYLLPLGISSYNRLLRQIVVSNPAVELEANSVKRTNDSTLVIGNVEGKKVSDILFFDVDANKNQRIIISGAADVSATDDKSVMLQLNMNDVVVFSLDPKKTGDYDVITSDQVDMNIFSSTIMPSTPGRNPNEYTFQGLQQEVKKMRERESASKNQMNLYNLELHKKFSLPFASIFFAFLALPLAIIFGKHNGQTIGLIIGIFLSFIYWAMMILGQKFSVSNGLNGAMTMWAPNALMWFLAVIFCTQMRRQ
ncbi:MAG: LptF/LptG family permease [Treponema sp.]|jgi:lipopolysaccharide export system permease protein|nr:LptF/LptG family permease [Treponema sp.]